MKSPSDSFKDSILKSLERSRENTKFLFGQSDKFMVWVVGFSIGASSLIAGNFIKFSEQISHDNVKTILILLCISIISGIIYRWAFILYQSNYQGIEFFIETAFCNEEHMKTELTDLANETDIKEVVRLFKEDYGRDFNYVLSIYEKSSPDYKFFLLDDLKKHYNKVGLWAKADFEYGIQETKDIY